MADAPAMVRMASSFHHSIPQLSSLPFSKMHTAQMFHSCMGSDAHLCLTLDLGAVCGAMIVALGPYPLGPAVLAKEVIFWVEPDHRGRWWRPMIAEAEAWAKARGAVAIGLSCFADGRTHKIFERAGYEAREIVTIKDL